MGDIRAWSPEPSGAVVEQRPSSPLLEVSNQTAIGEEYWRRAEAATEGIIAQVRPTRVSEERRKAVIGYVRRLIGSSIGCEVFPFGSVPLKTYLPDGDIDLTAFGGMNVEEALANDVCSVLEREDQNKAADFVVKDVQLIRAEVKLVKCLVQNILVDISFNQLGGLCTLCFLEQVDCLIGKDHLFKRSIILIKAWCYYESRILGAHHGLISTYALETLVLYIFHLFHSSLNGPLAVLHKFLDYYSKFDWDNYCLSLNGPIRISSLPEFVVETPESGACDLLLSNDFLKDSVEEFSVPTRGVETNSRTFLPKHLNIVDPLKENNNLGRSVSKGNFYRIRSAFTYGARKLGRILTQPEANVPDELCKFFSNTLDRHGNGQRPDVLDFVIKDGQYGFGATLHFPGTEFSLEQQTNCEFAEADASGINRERKLEHKQSQLDGVNVRVLGREMSFGRTNKVPPNYSSGMGVSENRLSGDAEDLATARIQGLSASTNSPRSSAANPEETKSPMGKPLGAPCRYFPFTVTGNGEMRNENPEWKRHESSGFNLELVSDHEVSTPIESPNHHLLSNSVVWSTEDLYSGHSGTLAPIPAARNPAISSLSDLSGDYESHKNSLDYGRWWYDCGLHASVPSMSVPLLAQFQRKNSWDVIRQSVQFRQNVFSQINVNDAVPGPVFLPMNPPFLPGGAFGMEEIPKPRGTGTYFPNTNHYRDRPLTTRGKNQAPIRSPRNNFCSSNFQETMLPERNNRELSEMQFFSYQGSGKSGPTDFRQSKPYFNVNGSTHLSERVTEFGSTEHPLPAMANLVESGKHSNPGSVLPQSVNASFLTSGMQRPKPILAMDQDGNSKQSYQLKDEDDFPRLLDSIGKGLPVSTVKKLEKVEQ